MRLSQESGALEIDRISVSYGSKKALDRFSVKIDSGEIVAVLGPNGAGKTTLIRALSGILNPTTGSIFVSGQDLVSMNPQQRARRIAVVPQARNLPADFTVYQTVLLGRSPYLGWFGQTREIDHQLTQLALQSTDCEGFAERLVGELSGGEQQRVLLARALAQDTPILLLDEPTTYLDLQHQSNLLTRIQKLAAGQGKTVLIVLHDLNLASLYANRIVLLVEGQIFAQGEPADVLTEDILERVYHIPLHIINHPYYGTPLVLPDGRNGFPGLE